MLLAALVLGATAASATISPARRQQALDAFDKAEKLHAALLAQPEGKRRKADFKQVIDAYWEVARLNPGSSKTPVSLTDIAELYRQMGREFTSDSYYLESIKTYRFITDQYPQNHISRDALFAVGKVYQEDLEDPGEARKTFENFIVIYPKSDRVAEAKEILNQLDQQAEDKTRAHAAPSAPPAMAHPAIENVADEKSTGLRQVTAVRRWVGPNYLRIVIEIDGEVKFESVRLSNPDRIVIDLQTAHLSPDLGARTFPVENGYLRQIRVAQFSPDRARVVLDVEKIEDYSIFSLPNPFRLVIDVQGTAPEQTAKVITPPPPGNNNSHKTEKVTPPAATTAPATSTPVATVAKTPTMAPTQAKTVPAPIASPSAPVETTEVKPPAETKHNKKSKDKTETEEANVTQPVQPAASTEDGSRTLTRALGLKIGRIVIDPGHGGHDTGTLGPTGLEEKEVVLDVGLKLRKLLQDNTNCEVVMTRSDDTFIPLEERTAIANEKSADLFISIHANASTDKTARGIETYYLNFTSSPDALEVAARENASSQEAVHQLQDLIKKIAMTEKIEESQDFARQVQREVYTHVTKASGAQRDRGIKKAPFVVLIGANMPSVLAEISFLTNPKDEHLLRRPDYREKIAEALYDGVLGYLKTLGEVKGVQRVAAADQTSAATQPNF